MSYNAQRYRKKYRRKSSSRTPGRNKHHFLVPKCRGGDNSFNNLLLIDIERHKNWHELFGVMTAEEVLALLTRVVRAKKNQKTNHLAA